MPETTLAVKVSNFIVHLKADRRINEQRLLSGAYEVIRSKRCDLLIEEKYRQPPIGFLQGAQLSVRKKYWRIYSRGGNTIFIAPKSDLQPYLAALFNREFNHGVVYLSKRDWDWSRSKIARMALVHFLNIHDRLLFHACGINDGGYGYLFLGHSGDGKTTMSRLWKEAGSQVLNDELVGVFNKNNRFFMEGTKMWDSRPAGLLTVCQKPLDALFFLHHGRRNRIQRLNSCQGLKMMLYRYYVADWDKSALKCSAKLLLRLFENIPCFSLSFVPKFNCINFIRGNRPQIAEGKHKGE